MPRLGDDGRDPDSICPFQIFSVPSNETPNPTQATEHQALACHCQACNKTHVATIPDEVRNAGLCGPELTSIIGFLKGACHASFATIRKYLRDVYQLQLSRKTLAKIINKVSEAIAPLDDGLFEQLKVERILNIDETGHRDHGKRMWTGCFRSAGFTVFRIAASRGCVAAHFQGDLPPPLIPAT